MGNRLEPKHLDMVVESIHEIDEQVIFTCFDDKVVKFEVSLGVLL